MAINVVLPNLVLVLLMVGLISAVVIVVVMVATRAGSHHPNAQAPWQPPPPQNPALSELDLRYARGEVERDEYLQRRADLLGQPPPYI